MKPSTEVNKIQSTGRELAQLRCTLNGFCRVAVGKLSAGLYPQK